jgi:hypothetical protein
VSKRPDRPPSPEASRRAPGRIPAQPVAPPPGCRGAGGAAFDLLGRLWDPDDEAYEADVDCGGGKTKPSRSR